MRTDLGKGAGAVCCVLLSALLLSSCSSSTSTANSPATPAPAATTAQVTPPATATPTAKSKVMSGALASVVALTPAEWGAGFKSSRVAENAKLVAYELDASCRYQSVPPSPSLRGQMTRNVERPLDGDATETAVSGNTTVSVFTTPADARNYLSTGRADGKRCPKSFVLNGESVANENIHEVSLEGFSAPVDELYAEEGQTTGGDSTHPDPYVYLVATKGSVVLSVFVGSQNDAETVAQNEARAEQLLTALNAKLMRYSALS
ncbi:hypothetical protein ABT247_21080 [Kitasatospora sp. NPDC001539]|uniref:hypothetical protein n=1 Tax=Kitasatospora sp. NPDC001539 TaxID=3154384 RepID=UPI003320DEE4